MIVKKPKKVFERGKWGLVARELEQEKLKLMSYDSILLNTMRLGTGTRVLDCSASPGVLSYALQWLGCDVKTFDISRIMNVLCAKKNRVENVYTSVGQIPDSTFDYVVCNLVLCINPEVEVRFIAGKISEILMAGGECFIGFCNPKIFDIPESALDIRLPSWKGYEDNHVFRK